MTDFKKGQKVLYDGQETHIENILSRNKIQIANPNWDWDLEAECIANGIEYDVQYWVVVEASELSVI